MPLAQAVDGPIAAERELVVTRVFDAPRALVFAAWTEPGRARHWWAPAGFAILACAMDVRPDGAWRRALRSPAGEVHVKSGIYREVAPPDRLVFTYADEDAAGRPGPTTVVTVTFKDAPGGGTELTLRQTGFVDAAARDAHGAGWAGAIDRCAAHLAAA
jgi:uncharacterized protein YndB with AHSA1/START domain